MAAMENKTPQTNSNTTDVLHQTTQNRKTAKPMPTAIQSNSFLYLVLILLFFSLSLNFILGYIAVKYADSNERLVDNIGNPRQLVKELADNIKPINKKDSENVDSLELVELYPEVEFTKTATPSGELDFINKLDVESEFVDIPGNYYTYQVEVEKYEESQELIDNFTQYYDKLTDRGWDYQIVVSGKRVLPVLADGPNGSLWGYVAKKENDIRAVNLGYSIGYYNLESTASEASAKIQCPCVLLLEVYESEIIDINELALREQ